MSQRSQPSQQVYISGHPLDTCHCGDFRRDHEGGSGYCHVCRAINHSFLPKCKSFQLSQPATQQDVQLFRSMNIQYPEVK